MKQRVLYFAPDKRDTTSFWRAHGVLPYISNPDFELISASDEKIWDWTLFQGISAFIFQRPFGNEHAQVITAAKNCGVKIILDYDDMLLDAVDMYNPTYHLYKNHQSSLRACLMMADEIWVSTPAIQNSYKHINPNITVMPNGWNDYSFRVKDKKPYKANKKVYYRGGSSHQADVLECAENLVKVINENLDWEFNFIGDRYIFLEQRCGDNYAAIEGITILEYFRHLFNENPSIMIFPLCDTKFNRGKSNICWLEATYAGASFFGNATLPEFDFEFTNSMADLSNSIKNCDHNKLGACNRLSWEYICDNLLLSNINKLRTERILNVIES